MTYAETVAGRPEFARELPQFVAEIRSIFSTEEIGLYLQHLARMDALSAEPVPDDDFMVETAEQRAARIAQLARLKEFLTASCLSRTNTSQRGAIQ